MAIGKRLWKPIHLIQLDRPHCGVSTHHVGRWFANTGHWRSNCVWSPPESPDMLDPLTITSLAWIYYIIPIQVLCFFYKVDSTPWPRCQIIKYPQIHLYDQVSTEVGKTCCTSWASQAPTTPASCPFPRPRGNAFNLAIGFVGVWCLCPWLPKPWKLYMCTHYLLKHLKFTNYISSSEFLGILRVAKSKSAMLVFFLKALQ